MRTRSTKFLETLDVRTLCACALVCVFCVYVCSRRGHCFGQGRRLQVNALFARSLSPDCTRCLEEQAIIMSACAKCFRIIATNRGNHSANYSIFSNMCPHQ